MKLFRVGLGFAVASAALLAGLAGCNDNDLGKDKRRANRPPQTILSSGPRDSTYSTSYRTPLFWSGSDPDGVIDHFDFILIDHPAPNDSIAASDPDYANRVIVRIPEANDPRWTATTANDTTIITSADTLRVNAAPPPPLPDEDREAVLRQHNAFVRRQSFQRWHTFFVRAVDNEGAIDPDPEYLSFNSTTLPPEVALKRPVDPSQGQFTGPRVIVFNWDGTDPVGDGSFTEPIAARWTIVPTDFRNGEYVGYPDTLYKLPPSAWQIWRRWDARDKSGRRAVVRNLIPAGQPGEGYYLFAVQAMDEAGAVTPIFDAKTPTKNNVARVFVNDQVGANLIVTERFLGAYSFAGGTRPVRLDVAAGQEVNFAWRGDALSYGGEIVAYRFGWNIRNPTNDEEWEQNWCATCRTAPERIFTSGTQRFFLETRDNAETVTHAEFELVVQQVTRRRDLLFVDDTEQPQGEGAEITEDGRWKKAIDALLAKADELGQHVTFDYSRDYYDVINDHQRFPPPLSTVFDYKTVVWTVAEGGRGANSAIKTLANFFDPFVERNRLNPPSTFNYLNVYVDNGGEFFYSGLIPADVIFTSMDQGGIERERYPANITNWDDRLQPHPEELGVGTRSLLWRLGVEMVDVGSSQRLGTRLNPSPRIDPTHHGAVSFFRSTPQNYERQIFTSTAEANHTHTLTVQTADVDTAITSHTLETSTALSHLHHVTITGEQWRALRRGEAVDLTTDLASTPEDHTHSFTVCDQLGLWGADATLLPDDGLWPLPPPDVNPSRGRVEIEIYNMASEMARQQPPLVPEPGISTSLYSYKSATAANPNLDPPLIYPQTADGQPVVILRKASATDRYYSRCIASFEPWRLRQSSMNALVNNILLRQFRLGILDAQ